jgi:hypothetical protein
MNYGIWRVDADANSTSSYYTVPQVSLAVRPYTLINGRFGLAEIPVGAGKLDLFAWGRNLANKSYETFIYAAPAAFALDPTKPATNTDAAFGQPRTYGVSMNFTY